MGGVAKRRFWDYTAPAYLCFIPCGPRRTALFSGKTGRIDQGGNGVPLGDFGPQFLTDFEGGDGEVKVDVRIFVARQEQADRVVMLVLQDEIGERHGHCKNTHNSLYLYDREEH